MEKVIVTNLDLLKIGDQQYFIVFYLSNGGTLKLPLQIDSTNNILEGSEIHSMMKLYKKQEIKDFIGSEIVVDSVQPSPQVPVTVETTKEDEVPRPSEPQAQVQEVKKENPWLAHVKKIRAEHPEMKISKEIIKLAKETYKNNKK